MAQTVTVRIDASDVIFGLERFQGAIQIANASAVARIRGDISDIINSSIELAFAESGLHPIYQNHLRQGLEFLHPTVVGTSDGLVAEFFDIESLGDYQELEQGFHYHAILAIDDNKQFSVSNPQRVELPYSGEDLYNDFNTRYDFWKAVVSGLPYTVTFGGGLNPKTGARTPSHSREINTSGMYEQTLQARVNWWGTRYPEWLLLEYGQDFEPVTPPTHFKDLMEIRVQEYMTEIYEEILDAVLSTYEQPGVTANSIGQLIDSGSGRYVKYLPR